MSASRRAVGRRSTAPGRTIRPMIPVTMLDSSRMPSFLSSRVYIRRKPGVLASASASSDSQQAEYSPQTCKTNYPKLNDRDLTQGLTET